MVFVSQCSQIVKKSTALVSLCLVLPLLLSCSSLGKEKGDEESFVEYLEAFNSAIRWEDYKVASAVIPPQSQEEFWRQADDIQGRIRIMEYQIRNAYLEPGGQYATALLRFRYYLTDDPHLRTKMLKQRWHYLEKEKVWRLVQFNLRELLPEKP